MKTQVTLTEYVFGNHNLGGLKVKPQLTEIIWGNHNLGGLKVKPQLTEMLSANHNLGGLKVKPQFNEMIWHNHNLGGLKVKPHVKALKFGFTFAVFVIAILVLAVVAAPTQIARSEGPEAAPAAVAWDTDGNTIAAGNFLGTTNNRALVFKVNNTERMRISNNGGVGIGTTSPSGKLHVQGGPVNIVNPGQGNVLLNLGSERAWVFKQFGTGQSAALELTAAEANNNNKDFLINTTGEVGIGTTDPQSKLHVVGGYLQIQTVTDNPPPDSDCDSPTENGRMVIRLDTNPVNNGKLYICANNVWKIK